MADRVFVHIGLPKTGTSYLQTLVWRNRDAVQAAGVQVPGRARRDHLLASMIVRDDPKVARRGPGAEQAWEVLRSAIARHRGTSLISHEFFCSARIPQWQRMVADLAPAEVHIVITAREPLGLFTSSWQEALKNKGTVPLADYSRSLSKSSTDIWNWRALDLGLVLKRLRPAVPDERVHVIVAPARGEPRSELWRRFAGVVGLDPAILDAEAGFPNSSMGVVEAELLRRLNADHLGAYVSARDKARWIRTELADGLLVTENAERFWPSEDQIADARARGERAVAMLGSGRYDVVGDPELLRVPASLPPRRQPSDVTDAEVLEASLRLNGRLLDELRRRVEEHRSAQARGGLARRLRRRLRR